MFLNIRKLAQIIRVPCRFLHKNIFKMDKAYLRHLPGTERFEIAFLYKNLDYKMERKFNFSRSLMENIQSFLTRVEANVDKVIGKKFKKREEEKPKAKAVLLMNNEVIGENVLCKDLFKEGNDVTLTVLDAKYQIIINSPFIDVIALPGSILADFYVYPEKFEGVFIDNNLCEFNWYKSRNKIDWDHIGNGFSYKTSTSDVNYYLKLNCKPRNASTEGPEAEIVSENVVSASPGQCPFETRHKFTENPSKCNELRVLSYNLLADLYADSDYSREVLFPYCPPYALAMQYRKQLIIKELLGYKSDIICLQEVDRRIFKHDLDPLLSRLNFGSYYAQKGANSGEGVACFYNKAKFKLCSQENLVLSEHLRENHIFKEINEAVALNERLVERFFDKQTVLQIVVLESLENGNFLIVANTHLYFHPDSDHIRLLQGGMCIKYVEDVYKKLTDRFSHEKRKISTIFCGDFNSVPECGIYKLYTQGFVGSECVDWASNAEEAVVGLSLKQSIKLESACGTPKYTNFTIEFKDCLDYIYYDSLNLSVTQVIPLPSDEELSENVAIPSIVFPSDHVSLIADLKWI